ncbi:MAG: hypothetical protein JO068_06900 [Hyphomicrobiales bacterium]|nr:hypothetical protein [Hyphomicrobiales bacterium]
MNFLLSRAVLSGCLSALKWMLWITALLLATLFVIAVVHHRGESPLRPIGVGIVACVVAGWACGRVARNVEGERAD